MYKTWKIISLQYLRWYLWNVVSLHHLFFCRKLADICPLLEVDDMVRFQKPDWKCVFTYVQSFYRRFRNVPLQQKSESKESEQEGSTTSNTNNNRPVKNDVISNIRYFQIYFGTKFQIFILYCITNCTNHRHHLKNHKMHHLTNPWMKRRHQWLICPPPHDTRQLSSVLKKIQMKKGLK